VPSSPTLLEHVDLFVGEWLQTRKDLSAAIAAKDFQGIAKDVVSLEGIHRDGNAINVQGNYHLNEAASLLLQSEQLQLRCSHGTARKSLIDAFFAHLEKARQTGNISEYAIVNRARASLQAFPRDNGLYVFPVVFAPSAKKSDFRLGPLRVVSKKVFLKENRAALRNNPSDNKTVRPILLKEWRSYIGGYDHFVTVDMSGYEERMAWPIAR
jgi:hypothetical protein